MRDTLKRLRFAVVVPVLLLAASLACGPNLFGEPTAVATQVEPPTAVLPEPTVASTSVVEQPTSAATAPPTALVSPAPTKPTVAGPDSAGPAKDPCSLPGIQFRANFFAAAGTSALTAPFSGDVTILKTAGGPNIFSIQQASVQRKFVIILKNLNPATHDLKSTYMSYTEKSAANDPNPRIWQAASGYLQVGLCPGGGLALRTVSDALTNIGDSVLFQPQPGAHNTASGDMLIGVGAKIQ